MIQINSHLWKQWVLEVHCVRSLSVYRCWSCNWYLVPDLKWRHSDIIVRDCMCLCSKAINFYEILHYSYSCWFKSALLYLCTGNSKRTQVGVDGLLNGYVACRWGGGCGLNKKARDGFCLRAPRQSDGRVVHIRDAYATRRADILNTKRTEKVRGWRDNSRRERVQIILIKTSSSLSRHMSMHLFVRILVYETHSLEWWPLLGLACWSVSFSRHKRGLHR